MKKQSTKQKHKNSYAPVRSGRKDLKTINYHWVLNGEKEGENLQLNQV